MAVFTVTCLVSKPECVKENELFGLEAEFAVTTHTVSKPERVKEN